MSAQACYPGDYLYPSYPPGYPYHPGGLAPHYGWVVTGTPFSWPITEDRIREIIREEVTKALEALKEHK